MRLMLVTVVRWMPALPWMARPGSSWSMRPSVSIPCLGSSRRSVRVHASA
jgi:hypothetical protein